jgi:hypothetical protein
MTIKIERQNYSNLLVQRFFDDDEIDDVTIISNAELLALMKFVKKETNGDWADVLEYLSDKDDQV